MFTTPQLIWTDLQETLECPVCGLFVQVQTQVEIKKITVRHTSSTGLDKNYSSYVESEVLGARFHHDCSTPHKVTRG